jgi:membrane associated rhomboid family serine protease
MTFQRSGSRFFEIPHAAVFVIMTANVVIFALCLDDSGSLAVRSEVLFRNGALHSGVLEFRQYSRFVTYGFLHANALHLATNMLCLALWGGHLERRVGSFNFLVIYFSAVIAGGIASLFANPDNFLLVGASGGVSGVLGALLCLWLLGKIDLTANFFFANIVLNVVLMQLVPQIDWACHAGGFAAGMIACAVLDVLERLNALLLRCKFPEFVKVNGLVIAASVAALLWINQAGGTPQPQTWPLAFVAACLAAVKLTDVLLSRTKGLAIVVVVLAIANAVLVVVAGEAFAWVRGWSCASSPSAPAMLARLFAIGCANVYLTAAIAAVATFALTILLHSQELYRGIRDVGFVAATLRAERLRRRGL